jgi:hypothetical protein
MWSFVSFKIIFLFGVHKASGNNNKMLSSDPRRLSKNIAALLKWHRAVSSYWINIIRVKTATLFWLHLSHKFVSVFL